MPRQKPFRTLKTPVGTPDHFTIAQADAAVLAVMAERGETPAFDFVEDESVLHPRPSVNGPLRRWSQRDGRR